MKFGFSQITIIFLNSHYRKCCEINNLMPKIIGFPDLCYVPSIGKFIYGIGKYKVYVQQKELRNYRKVIRLNHKLLELMKVDK